MTYQYFDDEKIPEFLKQSTGELALYLIKRANAGKDEASVYSDELESLSLGGGAVNLNFRESDFTSMVDVPANVYHMIRDFLKEVKEMDPSVQAVQSISLHRR
jgi:hypothetical protein